MAPGRTAWLLGALGLLAALPSSARADTKLQGVGEVTVAATDNAQSSPNNPVPGVPPKAADVFVILSPGVVLGSATPRVVQRLQYTYSLSLFFKQTGADTSSNRVDYLGFYDLSPRVTMLLTASLMESRPYSASLVVPPAVDELSSVSSGSNALLGATTDEQLDFDVAPGWRAWQGAGVAYGMPLSGTGNQRTLELGARTGLERVIHEDAFGLSARGDYTVITGGVDSAGAPVGEQQQLVGTGVLHWRHDWGHDFSSRIEGGGVRVQRLRTGRGFWEPTATAALDWANERGNAELSASHRITTNPLLGQSLVVDEAQIRGGVPFDEKATVVLGVSAGYQRGRLIEEDATLAAHVDMILADVGIAWRATDSLELGLRYQHAEQISDAALPPLPLSFVRNTVLATATLRFPSERDMPRVYRAPRRVDQRDEIRDGVKRSPAQP